MKKILCAALAVVAMLMLGCSGTSADYVGGQEGCREGNRLLADMDNLRVEDDAALLKLQSLARLTASAETDIRSNADTMARIWGESLTTGGSEGVGAFLQRMDRFDEAEREFKVACQKHGYI